MTDSDLVGAIYHARCAGLKVPFLPLLARVNMNIMKYKPFKDYYKLETALLLIRFGTMAHSSL